MWGTGLSRIVSHRSETQAAALTGWLWRTPRLAPVRFVAVIEIGEVRSTRVALYRRRERHATLPLSHRPPGRARVPRGTFSRPPAPRHGRQGSLSAPGRRPPRLSRASTNAIQRRAGATDGCWQDA